MSDAAIHIRESGIRKAAILFSCLEPGAAEAMLSQLPSDQARQLQEAAEMLGEIDSGERQRVVDDFLRIAPMVPSQSPAGIELDSPHVGGRLAMNGRKDVGRDRSYYLGQSEVGRRLAARQPRCVGSDLNGAEEGEEPFGFLSEAEDEKLSHLLEGERPQTVALVLSHLPSVRAGGVLAHFPPTLQVEIIRRLVDLEETDPAILHEVSRALQTRLSKLFAVQRRRVAGLEVIAGILDSCDDRTSGLLLENLATCDRALAEKLGLQAVTFEQLESLDDSLLTAVLRSVDPILVQTAMIGATPSLVERVLQTMPSREARRLQKHLDHPGPLRLSDVEDARRQIAATAQRMMKQRKKPASAA